MTPAALLEKHRGHESHPPSASQREMLARLRSAVLKSTSDPDRVVLNRELSRNKKKDEDLNFQSLIMGKNAIYLFDKSGIFVEVKSSNFDVINMNKSFKGFKDYAIYKKQFYLLSENSINKF